jgi:hypothetical protein
MNSVKFGNKKAARYAAMAYMPMCDLRKGGAGRRASTSLRSLPENNFRILPKWEMADRLHGVMKEPQML